MSMLPDNRKKTQAVMFDPNQEREAARKRQLAELLVQQGNAPNRNEQAGGMTVLRSPWENILQGAQKYKGEYDLAQADEQAAQADASRGDLMAQALGQLGSDPQGAAQMLMQDPSQRENAMSMYAQELNRQRQEAMQRENWSRQERMANAPTSAMRDFQYFSGLDPEQQQAYSQFRGIGSSSTGAIESLANRIIQENPDLDFMTALSIAQKGAGQGRTLQDGQIVNIGGYNEAVADTAGQTEAAKARAKMVSGPMPANIVKEQGDIVEKINTSRSLENSMGKFINQIDTGALDLGVMSNLENMARNNLGMSTEQSRNLQSFKATLERLRNESLRLNTGVQTDGDAQRAWNELVSNINDPQVVRQRLSEIGEINRIGAELQNQRLNLMRSEYGRGDMPIPNTYQANNTSDVSAKLRDAGYSDEDIQEYIRARGL